MTATGRPNDARAGIIVYMCISVSVCVSVCLFVCASVLERTETDQKTVEPVNSRYNSVVVLEKQNIYSKI
jgi:hypothetical protein